MVIAYDKRKERVSIRNASSIEKYYCPLCNEELIQKKGTIRCHHFAHKSGGACSEFKYYDTSEWHLNWQNKFPIESQEVIKIDENGKKHIADILVGNIVIEFQHSNLPYNEFNDRNKFYNDLGYQVIWVFDGNEIFNSGYTGESIYFRTPLKCLQEQDNIPKNINIFVEGTMKYNLFEEEGTFLYHVGEIDQEIGVIFNGKCTPEEFFKKVMNNKEFIFEDINNLSEKEKNNQTIDDLWKKADTLVNLFERHERTEKIIAYNIKLEKDILLDKDNYLRMKSGKTAYGKLRNHMRYGKFYGDKVKIFYPNDNQWFLQWYITEDDTNN